jgi:O-antigen/teichoic acid export membrane protein
MMATARRFMVLPDDLALLPIASAVVSRLSVYATLIVTARLMDGEQFGVYAVCLVVVGILSALVTGGGDMWLNRFTGELASQTGQAPRLWPVYFAVVSVISIALLAAVSLAEIADLFPERFGGLGLTTVAAATLVGMSEALLAVMRAGGAVRLFFVGRDILAPVSYLVVLIWLQPDSARRALFLLVTLWGAGFIAIISRLIWRAPLMLPAIRPPLGAWAPVVRHTLGLIYGNLASRLSIYVDVLALTTVVTMTTAGEYRAAAQFTIGFMVIQHFVFLGLPWQMRRPHRHAVPSAGLAAVVQRQRVLILLAATGGVVFWMAAYPLLALLGDRFVAMVPIFRILLLTRFASLLWGPQHEILVSNGLPVQDAHANMVSLAVWCLVFGGLLTSLAPLPAIVIANIVAALALHLYRRWLLRRYRLPEVFGHSLGPSAPLLLSALALCMALWALPD